MEEGKGLVVVGLFKGSSFSEVEEEEEEGLSDRWGKE